MTAHPEPAPTGTRETVLADLVAEGAELDGLVADLPASRWRLPTPAPRWTIAHQIAHLNSSDIAALAVAKYAGGPRAMVRGLADPGLLLGLGRTAAETGRWFVRRGLRRWSAEDVTGLVDALAESGSRSSPATLLDRWRRGRTDLTTALATVPDSARLPWFGARLRPASMATARLMETWAHGQDIADALGVVRQPTARLRHIARLAFRTRDHAYRVHGRTPPAVEFRLELTAPDGTRWAWGPEDVPDRVTGPALDFCLLATRRRNVADLELVAQGAATEWLPIAQAFVGPPGEGRAPSTQAG